MSEDRRNIVEEYFSPDRLLRLIVIREPDGDISISFDGYAWHTHGDILAELSSLPQSEAIRQFVKHVTGGDQIIAVSRIDGTIRDVWATDDPTGEFKYKPREESIEFRHFDGEIVPIEPSNS